MTSSDNSSEMLCGGHLYPVFDENGTPILPCGQCHCTTKEGKSYVPTTTVCANAKCGKKFRPACPSNIFCCRECFEATNTQHQWDEAVKAKLEHKRQLEKARRTRYLHSEKGKRTKSAQNKRHYQVRKGLGKPQAAYARQKALRQAARLPKSLAISNEKPDISPLTARH